MSREKSPIHKKALKIWLQSGRQKKPVEIAAELGVAAALVRKWKSVDKWEELPDPKRGAPHGNRNAKGNRGGNGGPPGNVKGLKHGLFRKFLPDDPETREIYDMTADLSPLDLLWEAIRIMWTNFIRSQRIQHVTGKEEMIKELKKRKFEVHNVGTRKEPKLERKLVEEEFEFQFAWDRQATALTSQSAALNVIVRKIKQYEELLRATPPEDVREEQRLRMEKLKAEVDALNKDSKFEPVIIKDDVYD
jgi:uncharacterized protein YjcR